MNVSPCLAVKRGHRTAGAADVKREFNLERAVGLQSALSDQQLDATNLRGFLERLRNENKRRGDELCAHRYIR